MKLVKVLFGNAFLTFTTMRILYRIHMQNMFFTNVLSVIFIEHLNLLDMPTSLTIFMYTIHNTHYITN